MTESVPCLGSSYFVGEIRLTCGLIYKSMAVIRWRPLLFQLLSLCLHIEIKKMGDCCGEKEVTEVTDLFSSLGEGSLHSDGGDEPGRLLDDAGGVGSARKLWHEEITQDLRTHLIDKLVQAIVPVSDPAVLKEPRFDNVVTYARNVEGLMYESANSRSEYYHMVAEMIYKIQMELEEKRRTRVQPASQDDS